MFRSLWIVSCTSIYQSDTPMKTGRNSQYRNCPGRLWLLLLVLLSTVHAGFSTEPNQYQIRHFTLEEGLADNNIIDITFTSEGYTWLATPRGLTRFDGYNFVNFSQHELPHLFPDNRVDRFHKKGDQIFLLSERHGLLLFNPSELTIQPLRSEGILSMSMQGDTTAYFFANGDVEIWINKKLHSKANHPTSSSSSIVIAHHGVYLTHNTMGILALDIEDPERYTLLDLVGIDPVGRVQQSIKYGAIYITGNRVFSFADHQLKLIPDIGSFLGINSYTEDDLGYSMFIAYSQIPRIQTKEGLMEIRHGNRENIEHRKIIRVNANTYMVATNQGLIQIGLKPRGIRSNREVFDRYAEYLFVRRRIVEAEDGTRFYLGYPGILKSKGDEFSNHSHEIAAYYDGLIYGNTLYTVTEGSGFMAVDTLTGDARNLGTPEIGAKAMLYAITLTSENRFLVGGIDFLALYDPETNITTRISLPQSFEVYRILEVQSHNYLIATSKGVFRLSIHANKTAWLATPQTIETRDILRLPDRNEIWYATREGIFICDEKSDELKGRLSDKNTLSNSVITALLRDTNGKIWASTFSGITIIDPADWSTRILTRAEGLVNQEYNFASALILRNGDLVFGGLNAYDFIQADVIEKFQYADDFIISGIESISPEAAFFRVMAPNETNRILLNTGFETLNLYLTNLDYAFAGGYAFEYKLNKLPWQRVNSSNKLQISNLSYGNHSLKIRMVNPMGKQSNENSYTIFAQVPWYQQPAFYMLAFALLLIAGGITFHFYRRTGEIESDTKSKIAMDLHDEAGSILTRLILQIATTKNLEDERESIRSDLADTLYSLRAFITSFSQQRVTLADLQDDLKELTLKYAKPCLVMVSSTKKPSEQIVLSNELFRDIKLSVYELINNNVKHSSSPSCQISIETDGKLLLLNYIDPAVSETSAQQPSGGYGYNNLRKRAQRNGGQFEWINLPQNGGFQIKLTYMIKTVTGWNWVAG